MAALRGQSAREPGRRYQFAVIDALSRLAHIEP